MKKTNKISDTLNAVYDMTNYIQERVYPLESVIENDTKFFEYELENTTDENVKKLLSRVIEKNKHYLMLLQADQLPAKERAGKRERFTHIDKENFTL